MSGPEYRVFIKNSSIRWPAANVCAAITLIFISILFYKEILSPDKFAGINVECKNIRNNTSKAVLNGQLLV